MGLVAPEGINDVVYKTKRGAAYHNDRNCELLLKGQRSADNQDKNNYPINPTSWTNVAEFGPCSWCCAYFFYIRGKEKKIFANIAGQWIVVDLLAERPIGHGHREYRVRTESGEEIVLRKKDIKLTEDGEDPLK